MDPIPVFLGLDVGKRRDRAAWVGLVPKRLGTAELPVWAVVVCEQAPLGTPYAAVAARTRELSRAFSSGGWPVLAAVDATGIGAAVVEDLRADPGNAEILAVTSHAGKQVTGQWPDLGVPKTLLVSGLDEVMRRQALTVTTTLPAAEVLKGQLKAYVAKLKPGGRGGVGYVAFEAEHERDHDDTVSAAQLGVFAASHWWSISRGRIPGRDVG
ncbi:hypothetical protein [Streptomyces violaceusniger]|uniref:Terminase large subunit gp17-like C-terminal domain-containing protein n=1 Tax=Streptomyces violaceusniger (strain Tu 4113) TaxID=653045 RepID=G2PHY5_STRV4|nr:hypothetical protein [Streptomyces violaceusniger]AEM88936.1 hypothetical protein Strvi_0162 [Streptomyces violaceusniger Tu 4113]